MLPGVAALRDHEFDVRYVGEESPGLTDEDVLAAAAQEGRILVTTDKDFGLLVVRLGHPVAGLILLRVPRLGAEAVAKKVAAEIQKSSVKLAGQVTTITEDRIRRRSLPRV